MTEPRLIRAVPADRHSGAGRVTPLEVVYQRAGHPAALPDGRHVLASIDHGAGPGSSAELALRAHLPQLGGEPLREVWTLAAPPSFGEHAGLRYARAGALLFGALELPGEDLEQENYDAYRRLLAFVTAEDRHLLRMWNVIPRLHEGPAELDRYKQFCRGRARAFEAHHGAGFERHLCASSAVGSVAGPELVYFLASAQPGIHGENPRQVSAYHYPARYGPSSPSFARATRAPAALGGALFLSGTASIVGHESVHPGDLEAQTRETLRNMRALLGNPARSGAVELSSMKVYLRDAEGYSCVRGVLDAELGLDRPVLYLRADVCRPELLVEIEGLGLAPGEA